MKRWQKRELIIQKLEDLNIELEEYLQIWKKEGGGTTGHAIGSMINRMKEKTEFFKNYC
ncbi:hypothetical protein [uncultured Polaribacter sp.]|uniref:hypothetical protein n=1 Tax=uncultured Polaribacter sp. TaxID=174711 RepID=UPI002633F966|nr:hypothetical protein [uncultured Polaribacter sp.]